MNESTPPVNAPAQLSFATSARATRIDGTIWFAAKTRQLILRILVGLSLGLSVALMVIASLKMAALAAVVGCALLPLVFWGSWGMRQYSGQNVIASGSTNLNDLLTIELVRPLRRAGSINQVWSVVTSDWQTQFLINHLGIPVDPVATQINQISTEALYSSAYQAAAMAGQRKISAGSIFVAFITLTDAISPFLAAAKIHPDDLSEGLVWLNHLTEDRLARQKRNAFGGLGRDFSAGYTNFLDRFGQNISAEIEAGLQVYSSLGREETVEQLISTLSQATNPAVALIGPIGSGKTTLVREFTEQILSRTDVGKLSYRKVMMLSATALLSAATPETPIERIISEMLADAVRAKNVVLFFDEAQGFFMSKAGSVDISEILLPILQNTHLPMIFAFTEADWNHIKQIRPNLTSQMQAMVVPPADRVGTLRTLEDMALNYEARDGVTITLSALKEAINLSERYTSAKTQPGAAIDLLQAAFTHAQNGFVTERAVQQAIEATTGVKAGTAAPEEAQRLLHLEALIHDRMINQTTAVSAVSSALRRARSGVKDPNRPIGSFLFLGPTGVGKTELAKSLAAVFFNGEDRLIRLDMSEYQQVSDVTRILAAATESGTGSSFLGQIRQQPYSVVLLDEIEKAHPDILNLILQLLDEGRLTDTAGKPVSFKDCIIILTSNALADDIRQAVSQKLDVTTMHDEIVEKLISQQVFRPELLNRFDEIVIFRPLTPEELKDVVTIMVRNLNTALASQQISVELTEAAKTYVVAEGNDPRMGARPMRRALQRLVEDRISRGVLSGEITAGQSIVIDRVDLEQIKTQANPEIPPSS